MRKVLIGLTVAALLAIGVAVYANGPHGTYGGFGMPCWQ